ncbi:MAG: hypothetical protein WCA63_00315 [Gallionella sp.]
MTGKMVLGLVVAGLLAAASVALAQEHAVLKAEGAAVLPLSLKHRAALIAEMVGVKAGVAELSGLIAMGEWKAAAQQAERIRDSYIMKQKLTGEELEELERALPADFVEKDSQFHRHADGLAHAALKHDYELEVFYFSKVMEGCGACHARYATHVFEGFKPADHAEAAH